MAGRDGSLSKNKQAGKSKANPMAALATPFQTATGVIRTAFPKASIADAVVRNVAAPVAYVSKASKRAKDKKQAREGRR